MKKSASFRILALGLVSSAALLGASSAAVLLTAGDQIIGGEYNGTTAFVEGQVGTVNPGNNWPAAEPPSDLINGLFGGGGEKYLNFAGDNTGVIISPTLGAGTGGTIVTSMTLWNANDGPGRRPATYSLYGTNTTITPGGNGTNYLLSNFSLIVADAATGLPATSNGTTTPIGAPPYSVGERSTVAITNSTAYTSYLLFFPTLSGEPLFQLSEVAFEGTVVPEPSAGLLGLVGALLFFRRRR